MTNLRVNKCYVISSATDHELKKHTRFHFNERGIANCEFVDRYAPESAQVKDLYIKGGVKPFTNCFRCGQLECDCKNNIITPSEAGRWLAYKDVWKSVAVSKGWSLICEGELYFELDGLEKLSRMLADTLPAFNDKPAVILLKPAGVVSGETLLTKQYTETGNVACLMNHHCAQILLNTFDQVNSVCDSWMFKNEEITLLPLAPEIASGLHFKTREANEVVELSAALQYESRAESLDHYIQLLGKWLDTDDTLSIFQRAAFKELSVKQSELIKKNSPNQPKRHYKGQLDRALQDEYGFDNTFENWTSVNRGGKPIPWMTYSAIHYLDSLDLSECRIFEWGSGNSSLYFADRATFVISIESNPDWFEYASANKRANLTTKLREAEHYCSAINEEDTRYEVIIIDGDIFRRLECAHVATERLAPGGIIVLDNSDWLPHTAAFLRQQGFTQIDFSGPGPINTYLWCTSIFFRHVILIPHKENLSPGALLTGIKNERDTVLPVHSSQAKSVTARQFTNEYPWLKERLLPAYADIFTAQEGEDALLRRLLKKYYHQTGFYVDVGAHHPTRFSNTYHYYLKGWRGINIDPIPGVMALFNEQRPDDINLEMGIANQTGALTYTVFKEPAFNTFDPKSVAYAETRTQKLAEHSVAVKPLADVLHEYLPQDTPLTFLSVDVEGFELPVLKSNDWLQYRPIFVIAEALTGEALAGISEYLASVGYERVASTKNSYFFCEKDAWQELK